MNHHFSPPPATPFCIFTKKHSQEKEDAVVEPLILAFWVFAKTTWMKVKSRSVLFPSSFLKTNGFLLVSIAETGRTKEHLARGATFFFEALLSFREGLVRLRKLNLWEPWNDAIDEKDITQWQKERARSLGMQMMEWKQWCAICLAFQMLTTKQWLANNRQQGLIPRQ